MALAPCPALRSAAFRTLHTVAAGALVIALVAACATRTRAPVEDRTGRPLPAPPIAAPAPPSLGGAPSAPEADWRPPTYTVKRGDTLHVIALDHGLDYRDLAAWNGIENPNRIEVGQLLQLGPPGAAVTGAAGVVTAPLRSTPPVVAQGTPAPISPVATAGSRNTDNYKSQPKLFKEPYSEQALREAQRVAALAPSQSTSSPPVPALAPSVAAVPVAPPTAKSEPKPEPRASTALADDDDRLQWLWPASGKIVAGFSDTANLKGIDIGGAAGTPIVASAAGKVVYAGSGLRGYGKLIIVKHNATYLSAYAHNREIVVKEGQQVARGQKIAEMGNTDANDVKLHFEIRRLGKPVDPLKYLPPV